MAGGSMKGIKTRIRSMENTKQITKAMEMVASSKLRKAQARVIAARPYFETLYSTLQEIANGTEGFSSPFFEKREIRHSCYIVIAGDRGLAGGYNANVLRLAQSEMAGKDPYILPLGKRTFPPMAGMVPISSGQRGKISAGLGRAYRSHPLFPL